MKKFWSHFALPIIVLIFELLPWGAVLHFANFEGDSYRRTFSYFSMIPFGYANFAPLITAILTCVLLLATVFYTVKPTAGLYRLMTILSGAAALISFGPLLYGIRSFSVIGVLISIGLLLHTGLLLLIKGNR